MGPRCSDLEGLLLRPQTKAATFDESCKVLTVCGRATRCAAHEIDVVAILQQRSKTPDQNMSPEGFVKASVQLTNQSRADCCRNRNDSQPREMVGGGIREQDGVAR